MPILCFLEAKQEIYSQTSKQPYKPILHTDLPTIHTNTLNFRFVVAKNGCWIWTQNDSLAKIKEKPFEDENRARAAENGQRLPGEQAEHCPRQSRAHKAFQHSLQHREKANMSSVNSGPAPRDKVILNRIGLIFSPAHEGCSVYFIHQLFLANYKKRKPNKPLNKVKKRCIYNNVRAEDLKIGSCSLFWTRAEKGQMRSGIPSPGKAVRIEVSGGGLGQHGEAAVAE